MHVAPFHTRVPVHSVCRPGMHVALGHTRGPVHSVYSDELRAPRAAPFMSHCPTTARSMGTFHVHVPHPGAVKQT